MKYQLKIWSGAGTEIVTVRIYVNGGALDRVDKLWLTPANDLAGNPSWDAELRADFSSWSLKNHGRGSSAKDIGLSIASEALAERGWEGLGFIEILNRLQAGQEPKEPVNIQAPTPTRELTAEERAAQEEMEDSLDRIAAMTPEEIARALKR